MNVVGSGFVSIINYASLHAGAPSPTPEPLFTEDSQPILTESSDEILTQP
jgi:hypothetical protein